MKSGRPERHDGESWRVFLAHATQEQAWAGVDVMYLLLRTVAATTPTAKRLRKMIEQAEQIYEKRFGEEWLPF